MTEKGRWIVLGVVAGLAACGPSSKEIERARSATYTCPYEQVFKAAYEEIKNRAPPLAAAEPDRGYLLSAFRWHSKDGGRRESGAATVAADDVQFSLSLHIQKRDAGWGIVAEPRVIGQSSGGPRGRELTRKDADWPAWADGKTEVILHGVYERLKTCTTARRVRIKTAGERHSSRATRDGGRYILEL